jgi:hypothetical protein
MLVYTVYNDTRNEKKASQTRKVCQQLEGFLNSFKFNKFECAVKAYSKNKNWHISYKQKTDKKGITRSIPNEGYLFIGLNQIHFEIVEE